MGLGDLIAKVNDWGRRERNDQAGYGDEWQAAKAAELQRALQADEEERQAKREEREFRRQTITAAAEEQRKAKRNALLADYRAHVATRLRFDPKNVESPFSPSGEPDDLVHYGMLDEAERLGAQQQSAGERNLTFKEKRYQQEQAIALEAAKNDRERGEQLGMADYTAGLARATHSANGMWDEAHRTTTEHTERPEDLRDAATRQLVAERSSGGRSFKRPTPAEIAQRMDELRQAGQIDDSAQVARTPFGRNLHAFMGDAPDRLPSPQDFEGNGGAVPPGAKTAVNAKGERIYKDPTSGKWLPAQ